MKHIIVLILYFGISLHTNAQTTFVGRVNDEYTAPISGVSILSRMDPSIGTATDNNGEFAINLEHAEVIITAVGYRSVVISLHQGSNSITLEQSSQQLQEIIVSASREAQKRAEIPGAISVITAARLEELKPFGIEQIVNQASGVFMSTSVASGNEQHMMSVRSPISTKSLFLYLEDGIPIRPTAVFNHNALLEMNDLSFQRVEVLKGPASSIYGSEAIGGSFNFITKHPTRETSGSLGYQINDLGFSKYTFEVTDYANKKLGYYLGSQYAQRNNGPIGHSDYEKFATTFKTIYHIDASTTWINTIDLIDYRTDTSGELTESDYQSGNYLSDQSFSERVAKAFRLKSTLNKYWNDQSKTTFNLVLRDNRTDQIPSYRIRQFRDNGVLTGKGEGEINSNHFQSIVGLVQHKIDFNIAKASLIVGSSIDYSPQSYQAQTIAVTVDTETANNNAFKLNHGDYLLNYKAGILNYAGYAQLEFNPITHLKLTAALRYDGFKYNYDNQIDRQAGAADSTNKYHNFSPKIGFNYNFNRNSGLYVNYANGFSPPQTSTLYRNKYVEIDGQILGLKPSKYNNYEVGGYFASSRWKLDIALYVLDGINTLVTLRNDRDQYYNSNAGKTRSYGVEYGITYNPIPELRISHSGSFAKHRYIEFYDSGINYSDTNMETAPKLLGMTQITYTPSYIQNLALGMEYEMVGSYNSSLENQYEIQDGSLSTATYDGHHVFNLTASYSIGSIELWIHGLNIFDRLYATRASFNAYSNENNYTPGSPRAFHLGVRYKF
jgi:outer membrane receptor protein involved in Fe transport